MRPWVARVLVGSPVVLAMLRVAVAVVILVSPELADAPRLAASPERLAYVPEGLHLVARAIVLSPAAARALQIVAYSAGATAILGFASRASMLALTLSAGLLFSLSQRQGAVLHDMHLFWMTALLAASPCGDAWSLDAWGKARPPSSTAYGVPLALARLFLGLVYFFPGLHKLRVSGLAWASPSNVTGHMYAKWLETGAVPILRIDHVPWLCATGAALVIAFELSFVFLALASKRTRVVALVSGVLFHAATQTFFFIPFASLWACYVVLLDGEAIARLEARVRGGSPPAATTGARPSPAPIAVGVVVAIAAIVQGARAQTQAWPFACYPTFAHLQPHEIPDLVVEVALADGTTRRLTGRERRARSPAEWGRVFRISGAYGDAPDAAALADHARVVIASAEPPVAPAGVLRVRVLRVEVPTEPERWTEPPRGGVVLTTLPATTR